MALEGLQRRQHDADPALHVGDARAVQRAVWSGLNGLKAEVSG
jgi:hypothetical protein